jgi:hypothetical protein
VFAVLFGVLTQRIIRPGWSTGSESATAKPPLRTLLSLTQQRATITYVLTVTAIVFIALLISPNGFGYRAKGALLLFAGPAYLVLELQHWRESWRGRQSMPAGESHAVVSPVSVGWRRVGTALAYFTTFELAAILTLTLDWTARTGRWVGVGSQLLVGVVGLVALARLLAKQKT